MASFNSYSELVKALEKAHLKALKELSKDTKDTVKKAMKSKGIGDTGKMERSLKVENVSKKGYEVTFKDGAGHTSWFGQESIGVKAGDEVYVPYWVNEGHTVNSNGKGFVDVAQNEIENTTTSKYEELLMKHL